MALSSEKFSSKMSVLCSDLQLSMCWAFYFGFSCISLPLICPSLFISAILTLLFSSTLFPSEGFLLLLSIVPELCIFYCSEEIMIFFLDRFISASCLSSIASEFLSWGVCHGLCLTLEAFLKYLVSIDCLYLKEKHLKGRLEVPGLYPIGRVYSVFSLYIFKSNFWNMAVITVLVPDLWQIFSVGWWNKPKHLPNTRPSLSGLKLSLWPPLWQGHGSGHGPKWRSPGDFRESLWFSW